MATQEERLQAALGKLTNIQAGVDRIQAELEALRNGHPELEDELSALEAAVGALDTDVNPATGETSGGTTTDEPV